MFVIAFDKHGGFFDHVRPPPCVPPGASENPKLKTHNFPFDRPGVLVPALVTSPYIAAGTIDHTQYDHTSILKTVDKVLGLNGSLNLTAAYVWPPTFRRCGRCRPRARTSQCAHRLSLLELTDRRAPGRRVPKTHSCRSTRIGSMRNGSRRWRFAFGFS